MPSVSTIILTKNRVLLLEKAFKSLGIQTFLDMETVVVNDGSTDETAALLNDLRFKDLKIITHNESQGIIKSRQEALEAATGEYVAFLDDDDEWIDPRKLEKQVVYFKSHPDCVLVGGGIEISNNEHQIPKSGGRVLKFRPETDKDIRRTMLLRNNFFTSTVMFSKAAAMKAGGFIDDGTDAGEDYDLWLRIGKIGTMYNFQEAFTKYRIPGYTKERFRQFLSKQLTLIRRHRRDYPRYLLASFLLRLRFFLK